VRALAKSGVLRRDVAALGLFGLAEYGPWVAMLVYAYSQGGSAATGIVSFALLMPTALFAPFGGPLTDRFGASRTLFAAYCSQAVVMAATAVSLLSDAPPVVSYVLGALTAMLLVVTHSAHAVVSPGLARTAEQLVALNAVTLWMISLGVVLAPAAAGLILEVGTPGAVYAAGAGCLVGSAVLVAPLRNLVPPLAPGADATAHGALQQVAEGAHMLARSSAPREVITVFATTYFVVGAIDVLAVVLAIETFELGSSGAAYLTATHGAGAVLGAVASLALVGRSRLARFMLGATLLAACAFVLLGFVTTVLIAFVVAVITGISRSVMEVSGGTLLQRVTSTALLARIFAFKDAVAMAAWALGSITVPIVIALADLRAAILVTGLLVPALVLRLRPLLAVDAAATVPAVRIALLRSLRIFRALPVPELEGVARNAWDVSVRAGEVIVRQGEAGDTYFAIADGTFEVVKGDVVENTLTRGDGFGEIALIDDVPRTATVRAVTDATLVAIAREPFLVAVTGHAPTRDTVRRVAAERHAADRD
jgi:hypothetical protein